MPSSATAKNLLQRSAAILLAASLLTLVPACSLLPDNPVDDLFSAVSPESQGGVVVTLEASRLDGSPPAQDDLNVAKAVLERRLAALDARGSKVELQGQRFVVTVPGPVDSAEVLAAVSQTSVLEFVDVSEVADEAFRRVCDDQSYVRADELNEMLAFGSVDPSDIDAVLIDGRAPSGLYSLGYSSGAAGNAGSGSQAATRRYAPLRLAPGTYIPILTGADIESVSVSDSSDGSGYYSVGIKLNEGGKKAWADATTRIASHKGKVAIVMNGTVQLLPNVMSPITNGEASISLTQDEERANTLKAMLESGSLPLTLQVVSLQETS